MPNFVTKLSSAFGLGSAPPLTLALAGDGDDERADIYAARHAVYAQELGQYEVNRDGRLLDATDAYNTYIVARRGGVLQGFIAVTPPGHHKAMERHSVQPLGDDSHELRLLTVLPGCRRRGVAGALMYAAMRYVEASCGARVEALARREILPLYARRGLSRVTSTPAVVVGSVEYVYVSATIQAIRSSSAAMPQGFEWALPFPCVPHPPCTHGCKGIDTMRP